LSVRGDLEQAEREAKAAREVLAASAPWAEGDAWRVLGDLYLSRGELDGAESAYRQAHTLGWDPNPGYARLLVTLGRYDAGVRSLEQTLADPVWSNRERRGLLLSEMAILTAQGGDLERAGLALAELEHKPELADTPAIKAQVIRARAELGHTAGRTAAAATELRQALRLWREIGSPLNLAATHLRLAEWLASGGDTDGGELDLAAAEALAETTSIPALMEQCAAMRRAIVSVNRKA
jgi:tetratricopeptide (TPR) repeat protein